MNGRWGPRIVEPYSFRLTKAGNFILYVVNDRDQIRGYRADLVVGVRPTSETFVPRFAVEF